MSRCNSAVLSISYDACLTAKQAHSSAANPSVYHYDQPVMMPATIPSALRHVLVYGTLKRNQSNHRWIEGSTYLGRRYLIGAELHDLGPYPMALLTQDSDSVIHGELYRVNDRVLARLDQLEGYPVFYNRSECQLSDGSTAWVYHGRREQVGDAPRVEMGTWATKPVLHYGSNLNPQRLMARCADWGGEGEQVQLEDWSWAIDKQSYRKVGYGYAGIRPCPGAITLGVVTHLTARDITELDNAEGVRTGHYRHQRVRVRSSCGTTFEALVYVPCEAWRRSGLQAEADYVRHIFRGLDHWNLPVVWKNTIADCLCTPAEVGISCHVPSGC